MTRGKEKWREATSAAAAVVVMVVMWCARIKEVECLGRIKEAE